MVALLDTAAAGAATGRIAVFLPGLWMGGAERVCLNLMEDLAAAGSAIDLVVARAEGELLGAVPPAVRLMDLSAGSTGASLPGLVRYLRSARPAALLSAVEHANVVALLAGVLAGTGTRRVISIHGSMREFSRSGGLRHAAIPWIANRLYRRADAIIAVSGGIADDLAESAALDRGRVEVVYNPVVGDDIAARCAAPADHPWFAPDQPPVVIAIGRLVALKGYDVLLHAFARLRRERPVRLAILGGGEEREALSRLAAELGVAADVWMPGFVPDPYPYLGRAAVFALSSRSEGLPTALIEAMACGVPVVATDCPHGPREILLDGRLGPLVPVGSAPALAAGIGRVLDDPLPAAALRGRAGDFHRRTASARYLRLLLGE